MDGWLFGSNSRVRLVFGHRADVRVIARCGSGFFVSASMAWIES